MFLGGFMRALGSSMMTCYIPVFFGRNYPTFKATYALLNAISLTTLGFSSALLGGIISDKYEKTNPMIKSQILIVGNFIALPLIALACWTNSFYVAMSAIAACIFATGSYYAPVVTMMQNACPPEESGVVVSALNLFTYTANSISPLIFSGIAKRMNAVAFPKVYGYVILLATTIGYIGANFFYFRGGKAYVKAMAEKRAIEEAEEN